MKKTPIFTGAGVAIITPMNADGSINFDELGRILDYQVEHGTDAVVICGTTGEASTLDDGEHLEAIDYTVKRINKRIPVIAGTGSNDTAHAIMMTKEAEKMGADATLQVTPYYNKTSQRGLIAHFNAIADCADIPSIVYSVASRTGVNIAPETAYELSKHPNINAIKEASGNLSQVAKIAKLCGDSLNIYSGNDDQIVPVLSLGGKGVISVLSNVAPQAAHDICRLWFDGKPAESLALQMKYLNLCNDLFVDVNPIPVKFAMNELGFNAGQCRLPLVEMTDSNKEKVRAALREMGLI